MAYDTRRAPVNWTVLVLVIGLIGALLYTAGVWLWRGVVMLIG